MEDFKRKTNNIFGIKETLKNQLNILGAEITNITTFRAYADWLDTWVDNLYKKIRDITVLSHNGLYGKTSQISKNLVDLSTFTDGYVNGSDGAVNPNHTNGEMISGFIPVKPSTQYTFSVQETTGTVQKWIGIGEYSTNSTSGFIRRGANYDTDYRTQTTTANTNYIRVSARNLSTATKVQLEEGDEVTEYASFSPTPEYPLEVKTFSGEQTVTIEGEETESQSFPVSLKSKNLFDASTIVAGDIKTGSPTIRLSSRQIIWLEEGTYTFSCDIKSPFRYVLQIQDEGKVPLDHYPTYILDTGWQTSANTTYTFTLSKPGWFNLGLSKENNAGLVVDDVDDFKYQLEKGSEATEYEPFYDIELCDIGGYQDYIAKTNGKNLLKFDNANNPSRSLYTYTTEREDLIVCTKNATGNDFYAQFITYLESGKTYTLSVDDDTKRNIYMYSDRLWGTAISGLTNKNAKKGTPFTFTSSYTGKAVIGFFGGGSQTLTNPMLNEGSTALPYEPYNSKGKWRIIKYTGKVNLSSSRNWSYSAVAQGSLFRTNNTISDEIKDNTYAIFSNYYKGIAASEIANRQNYQTYLNSNNNFLDFIDNRYTNVNDFKSFVDNNNIKVYYVLDNPVEKTLTEEEYPTLYKQLNDINDYLIKRFIKKELLAELDKPVIKEED